MAEELTRSEKADLYDQMRGRVARVTQRAKQEGEVWACVAETNLTAAAVGFLRGYFTPQGFTILGNDADMVLGIIGHVTALYEGGTTGKHLHAISNGATAPWLARLGESWGDKYKSAGVGYAMGAGAGARQLNSPRQDPRAVRDLMQQMSKNFRPL